MGSALPEQFLLLHYATMVILHERGASTDVLSQLAPDHCVSESHEDTDGSAHRPAVAVQECKRGQPYLPRSVWLEPCTNFVQDCLKDADSMSASWYVSLLGSM